MSKPQCFWTYFLVNSVTELVFGRPEITLFQRGTNSIIITAKNYMVPGPNGPKNIQSSEVYVVQSNAYCCLMMTIILSHSLAR